MALSLGSPPVDVIHHPALWSPDFPPAAQGRARPRSPLRFNLKFYCKCALIAPSLVDVPVGGGVGGGVSSAPHMADLHAPDSAGALFRLIEQGF